MESTPTDNIAVSESEPQEVSVSPSDVEVQMPAKKEEVKKEEPEVKMFKTS